MAKTHSQPPFPIGSTTSRTIQKVTGVTWLSCFVAGKVAEHRLHQKLGKGDIKVKVKLFSLTDLIAGKIKSVNVSISRCLIKSMPIGDVSLASSGPIWYDPGFGGVRAGLRNPIMLNLKAHLNRDQVALVVQTPQIASALRGLKLDLPGLGSQQLQVIDPKVELGDGLIKIQTMLVTEGAPEETAVHLTISGKPEIEGSRMYLRDMNVESPDIEDPTEFAKFTDELLNPIVDFGRMDRKDHALRLTDIQVKPDVVTGIGTLVLAPKNDVQLAQTNTSRKHHLRFF
ncbi:MAG: hypothetical protein ACRD3W_22425 [Terriglobales bacterium]